MPRRYGCRRKRGSRFPVKVSHLVCGEKVSPRRPNRCPVLDVERRRCPANNITVNPDVRVYFDKPRPEYPLSRRARDRPCILSVGRRSRWRRPRLSGSARIPSRASRARRASPARAGRPSRAGRPPARTRHPSRPGSPRPRWPRVSRRSSLSGISGRPGNG